MKATYYTAAWRGGEGWYAFSLAQSLAEAGVELTFIASAIEPADREVSHANLRRWHVPAGTGGKGSRLFRAAFNLYRVIYTTVLLVLSRFYSRTLLITFSHWLLATFIQFVLLKIVGTHIVYIIHDAKPHAWAFPQRFRKLEEWMLLQTYKLPTHLIVLTRSAKADLVQHFGIAPEKIDVVPHGAFVPNDPAPLPGNGMLLLFGMLRRNKRIRESIEAMLLLGDALPQVKMIIAGAPHVEDRTYWEECAAIIAANPDRFVCEIGFVDEERVPVLFGQSDAILLPYEDFSSQSGVAVLAALSRRPILSTGVGGIGELVEHGLACERVAMPVTAESIADSIRAYYARPAQEWRQAAEDGAQSLGNYLSWERIGHEVKRLMERHG